MNPGASRKNRVASADRARRKHLDDLKRIGDTPALARDFLRNAAPINSIHAAAQVV